MYAHCLAHSHGDLHVQGQKKTRFLVKMKVSMGMDFLESIQIRWIFYDLGWLDHIRSTCWMVLIQSPMSWWVPPCLKPGSWTKLAVRMRLRVRPWLSWSRWCSSVREAGWERWFPQGFWKGTCLIWLVGGLEHEFYDFPYTGNVIIPTDFHIFQRVETTNQLGKYNDLTVTSLEWCLVRGIIPKWPQVSGEWTMILYPEIWGEW